METTKVIIGSKEHPVRFSYAHVHEPYSMEEGGTKKYSISILISKDDKATIKKIEAAIALALEQGKAKFGGKIPTKWKNPLRDGDEERQDDETYENCMFVGASSTRKPGIVDENTDEIMSQDEFYSGCYGRASVNFYPFNVSGNKGVAAGLQNLQKLKDGDKLSGGGSSAADDFGDDDDLG